MDGILSHRSVFQLVTSNFLISRTLDPNVGKVGGGSGN